MVFLSLLLFILIFLTGARVFADREGYYSTFVVFSVAACVYYVGIPVELAVVGDDSYSLSHSLVLIPDHLKIQIILFATMALIGFALGYWLSNFSPHSTGVQEAAKLPSSLVLLLFLALMLLIPFLSQLSEYATYTGSYAARYENSSLSYLISIVIYCTTFVASFALVRKKARMLTAFFVLIPIVLWGVFASVKHPILLALLATASYFAARPSKNKNKAMLISIAVGVVGVLLLLPLFSLVRARVAGLEYYSFGLSQIDPAGPMVSLVSVISEASPLEMGQTYFRNLAMLTPKFIWSDRPIDLSEQFAREELLDWSSGQGMGYSLLAESFLNFSYAGPFVQYLLLGLFWGYSWRFIQIVFRYNPTYFSALYFVSGYYRLVIMHRGSSLGIVKMLFHLFVPLIIFSLVFDQASRMLRKRKQALARLAPTREPRP